MDIKALLIYLLLLPSLVFAHGGRTDKYGCHHDRKKGGYHCHNSGSAPKFHGVRETNNPARSESVEPQPLIIEPDNPQARDADVVAYQNLVMQTQSALNQLGYSAGHPDGVLGKKTIKAIKHFQVDNELVVDGKPSYLLLNLLVRAIAFAE